MSRLRRAKSIYCVSVIAVAIILDCTGGIVGWATAVIVLAGALPMFRMLSLAIAKNMGKEIRAINLYVSALRQEKEARQSLRANDDHIPTTRRTVEDQS